MTRGWSEVEQDVGVCSVRPGVCSVRPGVLGKGGDGEVGQGVFGEEEEFGAQDAEGDQAGGLYAVAL